MLMGYLRPALKAFEAQGQYGCKYGGEASATVQEGESSAGSYKIGSTSKQRRNRCVPDAARQNFAGIRVRKALTLCSA